MVSMIFLVCALQSGNCQHVEVAFGMPMMECQRLVQQFVADYYVRHKGVKVTKMICTTDPEKVMGREV